MYESRHFLIQTLTIIFFLFYLKIEENLFKKFKIYIKKIVIKQI